jgi:hypothetical protein
MFGQVAGMDYTMVVQMVVVSNPSNGQEDRSKTNHGINAGERTGLCCRLHTVPRREERGQSCQLLLRFFSRLGSNKSAVQEDIWPLGKIMLLAVFINIAVKSNKK